MVDGPQDDQSTLFLFYYQRAFSWDLHVSTQANIIEQTQPVRYITSTGIAGRWTGRELLVRDELLPYVSNTDNSLSSLTTMRNLSVHWPLQNESSVLILGLKYWIRESIDFFSYDDID